MKAIALETATTATAVGLDDGSTVIEEVVDRSRRHTESLAPAVARLLGSRRIEPRALDAVVVDVGPGLFTGLRVGIAFAKGICVAAGAVPYGVTSTEVLALGAFEAGARGVVLAVVDARRGEVFAARYARGSEGPVELEPPAVWTPGALASRIEADRDVTLVGDGAVRYAAALAVPGVTVLEAHGVPSPATALRLVAQRRAGGAAAPQLEAVRPVYLREADAVANFDVRGARS